MARWARFACLIASASVVGCIDQKVREVRVTIPAGTTLAASLETPLSTESNHPGDPFTATSLEPLVIDGKTAIPAGSEIRGTIADLDEPGRVKGRARMTLVVNEIVDTDGETHALAARPLTFAAKSGTRGDLEKLAAGGITGAVIGGIVGGKSGAVKGTAIGAGAGTVWVLSTKGDDVELGAGYRLTIRITGPLEIPIVARQTSEAGE
jgi:type IV secretion system protein VirB10